jgi:hypothetical protein
MFPYKPKHQKQNPSMDAKKMKIGGKKSVAADAHPNRIFLPPLEVGAVVQ